MASVSVSHLIIFIASLVVAAGVAGTLATGVDRVSSAVEDGSLDVSQEVRSDFTIISDPGATYNSGEQLTIHVRNTGSQGVAIDPTSVDIIFNEEFVTADNIQIEDANDPNSNTWRPGEVVAITIEEPTIQNNDNRLLLTVNADQELFEFQGS